MPSGVLPLSHSTGPWRGDIQGFCPHCGSLRGFSFLSSRTQVHDLRMPNKRLSSGTLQLEWVAQGRMGGQRSFVQSTLSLQADHYWNSNFMTLEPIWFLLLPRLPLRLHVNSKNPWYLSIYSPVHDLVIGFWYVWAQILTDTHLDCVEDTPVFCLRICWGGGLDNK